MRRFYPGPARRCASAAAARIGAWLWGSLSIFAVIPFTLVAILPTNKRLLEPGRDRRSDETRSLLEAWGRLHGVRSVLSLVASLLFVWALGKP